MSTSLFSCDRNPTGWSEDQQKKEKMMMMMWMMMEQSEQRRPPKLRDREQFRAEAFALKRRRWGECGQSDQKKKRSTMWNEVNGGSREQRTAKWAGYNIIENNKGITNETLKDRLFVSSQQQRKRNPPVVKSITANWNAFLSIRPTWPAAVAA